MAHVTFRLEAKDAQRAITRLRDVAPQRIARALNRAGVSARTQWVRDAAKDLAVKQDAVQRVVVARDARPDKLLVTLEATGARISLKEFNARQTRRGVTANTGRGRQVYPGSFIAPKLGGHVFKREGRKRFPILKLHGPSIPHVLEKHLMAALARGEEQLVKNLVHELKFATSQVA